MTGKPVDEVLDLSVHSLPAVADESVRSTLHGRWKMLAIVLVCSIPVFAACFAYYVVHPQGEAGFGELINPVRELPVAQGTRIDGTQVPLSSLKGQWLLVKVDGASCAQACQKQLYLLRQFRMMLGKDRNRVDWVWLINDQSPVDPVLRQSLKQDEATVLRMAPETLATWMPVPDQKPVQDYFFVVDPHGNTMMRLPSRFDTSGATRAKRDMERLLHASLPWDPPGR